MTLPKLDSLLHEVRSLLHGYPPFVRQSGGELQVGDVPVFVFHTVVPPVLEAQLRYLADNGYTTLSHDEFLATVQGTRRPSPREVLLTFDDARSSFWLYGFPMLRRFGAKATLFAITGWTPDAPARPNLDDVAAGRLPMEELERTDPDDREICSWQELRHMHDSGVVTVESHSHLHRLVFAAPRLVSVIRPDADFSPFNAIHSPYLSCDRSPRDLRPQDCMGLPLFPTRAFLEDGPAVRVDRAACESFRAAASRIVDESGGRLSARSMRALRGLLPASAVSPVGPDRLESEMRVELAVARETLRAGLRDPQAGRSLCIPFTLGGSTLVRTARHVGIEALFWGVSPAKPINRPGDDPLRLVRLKSDFIVRLAGRDRAPLGAVYLSKVRRRVAGERPY